MRASGEKHYRWKGGKAYLCGYPAVKNPEHHRANSNGYVKSHILIAEDVYGGPLPENASIHHANGDKTDNRNSNLVICQDESYHQILHRRMRALSECGNAGWRKCKYCKQYDKPENLYISPNRYNSKHRECHNAYMLKKRKGIK